MLMEIGKFMRGNGEGELDRHRASFDRLRIRSFLRATKNSARTEPAVEGRRIVLQLILVGALAVALSACGKKGAPEPPDPQSDQFPRQYPDPSSL